MKRLALALFLLSSGAIGVGLLCQATRQSQATNALRRQEFDGAMGQLAELNKAITAVQEDVVREKLKIANTPVAPSFGPGLLELLTDIREVKLRFDCINVFDEVYRLRDGTGLGISASQYGHRRTFLAGLSVFF